MYDLKMKVGKTFSENKSRY